MVSCSNSVASACPSVKTSFDTISLAVNSQHLQTIHSSWVKQHYNSTGRKKKSNCLKLKKGVRPETHILYPEDVPNGARSTAGHRHCKTHSTAFLGDLRGSPHCPAMLQRPFLAYATFSHALSITSPQYDPCKWLKYNPLVPWSIVILWAGDNIITPIGMVFLECN